MRSIVADFFVFIVFAVGCGVCRTESQRFTCVLAWY